MYEIEKNVQIPVKHTKGGRKPKYPFGEMEVGDSFIVEGRCWSETSSFRTAAFYFGTRHNIKFSVRKINENSVRCWRIK